MILLEPVVPEPAPLPEPAPEPVPVPVKPKKYHAPAIYYDKKYDPHHGHLSYGHHGHHGHGYGKAYGNAYAPKAYAHKAYAPKAYAGYAAKGYGGAYGYGHIDDYGEPKHGYGYAFPNGMWSFLPF